NLDRGQPHDGAGLRERGEHHRITYLAALEALEIASHPIRHSLRREIWCAGPYQLRLEPLRERRIKVVVRLQNPLEEDAHGGVLRSADQRPSQLLRDLAPLSAFAFELKRFAKLRE